MDNECLIDGRKEGEEEVEEECMDLNGAVAVLCKAALGAGLGFTSDMVASLGVLNGWLVFFFAFFLSTSALLLLGEKCGTGAREYSDLFGSSKSLSALIDLGIMAQLIGTLVLYTNIISGSLISFAPKIVTEFLVMAMAYLSRKRVNSMNKLGISALLMACLSATCSSLLRATAEKASNIMESWDLKLVIGAVPTVLFATSSHMSLPMTIFRLRHREKNWKRLCLLSNVLIFSMAIAYSFAFQEIASGSVVAITKILMAVNCLSSFPVSLLQIKGICEKNATPKRFIDEAALVAVLVLSQLDGSVKPLLCVLSEVIITPLVIIVPSLLHLSLFGTNSNKMLAAVACANLAIGTLLVVYPRL